MRTVLIAFLTLLVGYQTNAQLIAPNVQLNILVLDENKKPLDGVYLKAAYQGNYKHVGGGWAQAVTGTNGTVTLKGRSVFNIPLTATKEGYYPGRLDVQTHEWSREQSKNIYTDQDVEIILRSVKNPTPMYGWKFSTNLYHIGENIGFDLIVNDWVVPYGKGEKADFVFQVAGYYTDRDHYDSELMLSFSNEGDGFVMFVRNEQSTLKSPYIAPEEGYKPTKRWRKKREPIPGERHKHNIVNDSRHDANYIFRIRTTLDEQGKVISALYGKMYGDFIFGGASKEGSYIRGGVIYLNPVPNDRNLEFDPERNLFKNLSWSERVLEP